METVVRVIIIYVFLIFGLRVLGKREFSQLSNIEVVTLLIIPELVSQALLREDFSVTNALIAVSTLFVLVFFNSLLTYHSKIGSKILSDSPSILVHNGACFEEVLSKERVSMEEVYSEMRKSGIEHLADVKWALLEPDGKISIVPIFFPNHVSLAKKQNTPVK